MTERADTPEPIAPSPTVPAPPTEPASPASQPAPLPAAPVVAWEAPAPVYAPPPGQTGAGAYDGGPPPFTVGALLSDVFARYGADPIRFFAISLAAAILSFLGSLGSIGGNPFLPAAGDSSGLLGVLSFVVGLVAGSATLALAEGGPSTPFLRVLRRGVERTGWLFLTTILLIVGVAVIVLIAVIVLVLLAFMSPELAVVLLIALLFPLLWLGLRVSLALPANVADNLNSIEGLQLSWRVTKPSGVWARIFAASFLLGLLLVPASLGAGLLALPGMFGGQPALLLVSSLVVAFLTPMGSLISYSAYRRLVPPFQPSWTETAPAVPATPIAPAPGAIAAADAAPPASDSADGPPPVTPVSTADASSPGSEAADAPPPVTPAPTTDAPPPRTAPTFRVPQLGPVAVGILALTILLDVAGVLAVPYVIGEAVAGRIRFPSFPTSPGAPLPGFPGFDSFVVPGTVAFGTSADLDSCTVEGQSFVLPAAGPIAWLAAFEDRVQAGDEVFLRITRDGEELETTPQVSGPYDCLGSETPESGMRPGIYQFDVIVNGSIEATGSLIVQ